MSFSIAMPAVAYQYFIDVHPQDLEWTYSPYACYTAEGIASIYYWTEDPTPKYGAAEHADYAYCATYIAAKGWISPTHCYPNCWQESAWDIDLPYAVGIKGTDNGYWAYGKYQANLSGNWTTYFDGSPILPN